MHKNKTIRYTRASLLINDINIKRIERLNDADACLDRLTANAFRLEFNGIDMRNHFSVNRLDRLHTLAGRL